MSLGIWAADTCNVLGLRGTVKVLFGSGGDQRWIYGDQGSRGEIMGTYLKGPGVTPGQPIRTLKPAFHGRELTRLLEH